MAAVGTTVADFTNQVVSAVAIWAGLGKFGRIANHTIDNCVVFAAVKAYSGDFLRFVERYFPTIQTE